MCVGYWWGCRGGMIRGTGWCIGHVVGGDKESGYARVGDIERPNNQLYMDRAWQQEVDSCVALYFKYCIGGAVPTGDVL